MQRSQVAKNFLLLSLSNILSQLVLTIPAMAFLGRRLGVAGFGVFGVAQSLVLTVAVLTDFGLTTIGMKYVSRAPNEVGGVIPRIVVLRLAMAVVGYGVLLLVAFFTVSNRLVFEFVLAYGISFIPFALLIDWAFNGLGRALTTGISQIVRSASFLILVLFFVRSPAALMILPVVIFASSALQVVYLFVVFDGSSRIDLASVKARGWIAPIVGDTLLIGLGQLAAQFYYQFPTIYVGRVAGGLDAGYYAAASKLIFYLNLVAGLLGVAIFPAVTKALTAGKETLDRLMNGILRFVLIATIPIGVGGAYYGREIVSAVFGARFAASGDVFAPLIVAFVVLSINVVVRVPLIPGERNRLYFGLIGSAALATVVLAVPAVRYAGYVGAGYVPVVVESGVLVATMILARRIVRIAIVRDAVRPVFASAAMIGVVAIPIGGRGPLATGSFPLAFAVSVVTYLLVMTVSGGLTRHDFALVADAFIPGRGRS